MMIGNNDLFYYKRIRSSKIRPNKTKGFKKVERILPGNFFKTLYVGCYIGYFTFS